MLHDSARPIRVPLDDGVHLLEIVVKMSKDLRALRTEDLELNAKGYDLDRASAKLGQRPGAADNTNPMTGRLRVLWTKVCKPIVDKLLEIGVKEKSRVWWCPTGKLVELPLHAAGPYAGEEKNLPDIFISSYTPTLSSLIRARRGLSTGSRSKQSKILAIGQTKGLPKVRPSHMSTAVCASELSS